MRRSVEPREQPDTQPRHETVKHMNELDSTVYRRKCFLINLAYCVVIAAIIFLVLRYALSALTPFIIAALAAMLLRPVLSFLNQKLHLPRKSVGVVLTVAFYLCIAFLGLVLFNKLLNTATSFLRSLPGLWTYTLMPALSRLINLLSDKLAQMDITLSFSPQDMLSTLGADITSLSTRMLGMAGNFAFSLPSLLINIIICIVSTLFMLFDWDKIIDFIDLQLSSRSSELARKISRQSGSTIRQFIVSYGLILLITFTELSIGFLLIGVNNALLWAALISVFDILPVVGCGGILIPWTLINFIIGNTRFGIGLALLYLIITVVRNIVEPRIVGKQVGLHPLVTLMSMVIGSSLMGGVGLFGLPITLAVINQMNKDGVIHIYKTQNSKSKQAKHTA